MNACDLAREVRRCHGDWIKLIAMSGHGQAKDPRAAEKAGYDRHLTKPVDARALARALRETNPNREG